MDTEELRAALVRAQSVSLRMEQGADSLNASFRHLEQGLRGLGLRVYVEVHLSTDSDEDTGEPFSTTSLAWTKIDGQWSLAIIYAWEDEARAAHVTSASLEDRKIAAGKVSKLVAAMADALEDQVTALEQARAQVDAVLGVVRGENK